MKAQLHRQRIARSAIAVLTASLAALVCLGSGARADDGHTIIGTSQGGRLLIVYHIGTGPVPVFVMGAQHGGPEANTSRLVNQLYSYFDANRGDIPEQIRLDLMPEGNPDGLVAGSRLFQSGVDPNRNWGGGDWQTDAWDSNGVFRLGLGGSEPFSEIETRATRDYVLATRPAIVVNYHSRGGFMFGGREGETGVLASAYATASGYPRPQPSAGGGSVLGYRATGSMNGWLGREGLAGILIELTNFEDAEFTRNLAGLKAVLQSVPATAAYPEDQSQTTAPPA